MDPACWEPGANLTLSMSMRKSAKQKKPKQAKRRVRRSEPPNPTRATRDWNVNLGAKEASGFGVNLKGFNVGLGGTTTRSTRGLSECALDYACCLANPFTGPLACVPNLPILNTRKVRYFSVGSFQTSSTTNTGWIACDPNFGVASNEAAVVTSTAATAAVAIDFTAATNQLAFSNSDYLNSAFTPMGVGAEYRVVSCALRIRYTGTELNRGGQAFALVEPSHNTVQNFTPVDINGYTEARRFPITNEQWVVVHWYPILGSEFDFANTFVSPASLAPGAYGAVSAWPMVIFVTAPGAVTSTFEYEYSAVYELNGRNVQGKTISHADAAGFSAVQGAVVAALVLQPELSVRERDSERRTVSHAARQLATTQSTTGVTPRPPVQEHQGSMAQWF